MTLYDDVVKFKVPMTDVYGPDDMFLGLRVGSNCPQGGDTGHGGRTLFELYQQGGAHGEIHVQNADGTWTYFPYFSQIRLVFGGDIEHQRFADMLRAAADVLEGTYAPCRFSPYAKCDPCHFRQRLLAGEIGREAMPCEDNANRWIPVEEYRADPGAIDVFTGELIDETGWADEVFRRF